jgi:hypothetical protein
VRQASLSLFRLPLSPMACSEVAGGASGGRVACQRRDGAPRATDNPSMRLPREQCVYRGRLAVGHNGGAVGGAPGLIREPFGKELFRRRKQGHSGLFKGGGAEERTRSEFLGLKEFASPVSSSKRYAKWVSNCVRSSYWVLFFVISPHCALIGG